MPFVTLGLVNKELVPREGSPFYIAADIILFNNCDLVNPGDVSSVGLNLGIHTLG